MSDEQTYQIDRLGKALEVSSRTIQSLEKKVATLQDLVVRMEHDKRNWEQQKVLQEQIIKQQLATADIEKRSLQEKIIELRERLKNAA